MAELEIITGEYKGMNETDNKGFTVENQGTNTYLVYHLEDGEELDSFTYGMLSNNKIKGIVPAILAQIDQKRSIKFNVSSRISLEQYFNGIVNKYRFLTLLSGVAGAVLEGEEYMLDSSSFLLEPSYIYVNVGTGEPELICFPVKGGERHVDLFRFYKDLVFSTQFDQSEDTGYVARIISFLNGSSLFSLPDLKKMLDGLKDKEGSPSVPTAPNYKIIPQPINYNNGGVGEISGRRAETAPESKQGVQKVFLPKEQIPVKPAEEEHSKKIPDQKKEKKKKEKFKLNLFPVSEKKKKEKKAAKPGKLEFAIPGMEQAEPPEKPKEAGEKMPAAKPEEKTAKPMPSPFKSRPQPAVQPVKPYSGGMPETTILGGYGESGETTVLSMAEDTPAVQPYLLRIKTGQKIPINKEVFKIGKERSFVDFCIEDNPAVSRIHANVIKQDKACFVMDMNSKNHTFINGSMLPSNQEHKLEHGDTLTLANENFEYKVI